MQKVIEISNGVTRLPSRQMKSPVNLEILPHEQLAIVGPNGSGKSILTDILIGKLPLINNEVLYDFSPSSAKLISDNIKFITFRDSYGDYDNSYYYQQRWNQHDINEQTPTAGSVLEAAFLSAKKSMGYEICEAEKQKAQQNRIALRQKLYHLFKLDTLLDKYIISLSSGELRKLQLTKTLFSAPKMLILDNPFIGLDAQTREQLNTLLSELTRQTNLQIILVLSKTNDIPNFITHIVPVEQLEVKPKMSLADYRCAQKELEINCLKEAQQQRILNLPQKKELKESEIKNRPILVFKNIHICYGTHCILKDLNWTIEQGEKWALSGENGAGKSTLLSLICADNPQSYSCNIELFGRKRGTGESIWDIKKRIGYVSPEMHRAYTKDIPAIKVVTSGLNDTIGLYANPPKEFIGICEQWMEIFGIHELRNRTFLTLSSGEQRLCLLARAFVKDPELLILDEPLHGLDDKNRKMVCQIIETFCKRSNKTLIMVTHYKEEVPDIVTRHLHLKKNV